MLTSAPARETKHLDFSRRDRAAERGLGWLALRSAGEQQIILERRTAELYQKETEAVASAARTLLDDERRAFTETVRQLIVAEGAPQVGRDFTARLASAWPRRAIGFALDPDGALLSPSPEDARRNAEWEAFLRNNAAFLSGSVPSMAYSVSADELNRPEQLRKSKADSEDKAARRRLPPRRLNPPEGAEAGACGGRGER